jgi:hypothetical protein
VLCAVFVFWWSDYITAAQQDIAKAFLPHPDDHSPNATGMF